MDTAQVALVVAGIAGFAGIVQATVQGWLTSRSTRVIARQDAIKADLDLLQTLHEQLSALGQAANEYVLAMFDEGFYSDAKWESLRQPLVNRLLVANGAVLCSAYTLATGSKAREVALEAAEVAGNVGLVDGLCGNATKRNAEWSERSHLIHNAIEILGLERRRLHEELQLVSRNVLSRGARRLIS